MQPSTAKSTRISKGRSRNGCAICKIRRVKCDEQKPACRNCVSTGRKCDYPQPPGTADPIRIVHHIPGLLQPTRMWQVPQSTELINEAEYRALEFFQLHTTLCFGQDVGTFLLQAAYHESVIRTIAVAIGSLHRSFVHEQRGISPTSGEVRFAFVHYNKAIRQLVAAHPHTCPQTNDTFLIACILFFCLECLQGHYQPAFQHAFAGLKIIQQQQQVTSNRSVSSTYMPPDVIAILFTVLENQVLELQGDHSHFSNAPSKTLFSFAHPVMPDSQSPLKIEQIFHQFQLIYNRFTRFGSLCERLLEPLEGQSFEFIAQMQHLRAGYVQICTDFKTWVDSFDTWLKQPGSLVNTNPHAAVLKVWKPLVIGLLQLEWPPSELAWDRLAESFATVTSLAAETIVTNADSFQRSSSPNPPSRCELEQIATDNPTMLPVLRPKPAQLGPSTFSLTLGIVAPLYICATRCRDSRIRHQAIHLLSHAQRREGLWDSELAGRIAKRLATIEEMNAGICPGAEYRPADIPLAARISSLSPQFGDERRVTIRYNCDDGAGLVEETFTW